MQLAQHAGGIDFDLEVLPAPVPYQANNTYLDLAALPQSVDYPLISARLDVFAGTPAGEYDDMQHVYLNKIGIAPSGLRKRHLLLQAEHSVLQPDQEND